MGNTLDQTAPGDTGWNLLVITEYQEWLLSGSCLKICLPFKHYTMIHCVDSAGCRIFLAQHPWAHITGSFLVPFDRREACDRSGRWALERSNVPLPHQAWHCQRKTLSLWYGDGPRRWRPATDMWLFFLEPWSSWVCVLLKRNLASTDCEDLSIISLVCLLPKPSAIIPERDGWGFDVCWYSAVFKVRRSGCSPSWTQAGSPLNSQTESHKADPRDHDQTLRECTTPQEKDVILPPAATWMVIASEVSQRKTNTLRYHLHVGSKKRIQINDSRNRKGLTVTDNTLTVTTREGRRDKLGVWD